MLPMRSICNEVEEVTATEDKAVERTRWKRLCGLTIDRVTQRVYNYLMHCTCAVMKYHYTLCIKALMIKIGLGIH